MHKAREDRLCDHNSLEENDDCDALCDTSCVAHSGEEYTLERLQEIYHLNRKKLKGVIREFTNNTFQTECRKYIEHFMMGDELLKLKKRFPKNPYHPHKIFPDLQDDKTTRVVGAVTDIMDQIAKKLPIKHNFLKGRFIMVGSFRDGTKTGSVDEFDFVYILESINRSQLKLQKQSDVAYKVLIDDEQISACNYHELFSIAIKEIMTGVQCPAGMEHGGFAHPEFSSVRFNGPAVTLLLLWRSVKISVDLTLSIPVTLALERGVISSIEPIIDELGMTSCDMEGKVHLIPMYPDEENWYISTSQLEADLLHAQHPRCEFKVTIRMIKSLQQSFVADMWKDPVWLDTELCRKLLRGEDDDTSVMNHVMDSLEVYAAGSVDDKRSQRQVVSRAMEYGHHQLSAANAQHHGEISKPCVALNTSGIKYGHIRHVRRYSERTNTSFKEEFSRDYVLKQEQLMHVMENIVKHPFVPYDVCMFSVAGYAAKLCHPLVSIAQAQCQFVAGQYKQYCEKYKQDFDVSQVDQGRKKWASGLIGNPCDDLVDDDFSLVGDLVKMTQPLVAVAKAYISGPISRYLAGRLSGSSFADPHGQSSKETETATTSNQSLMSSNSPGQELPEALQLITKYKHLMKVNSRIVKDIKAVDPMWKEPDELNLDDHGRPYFQIEGASPSLYTERRSVSDNMHRELQNEPECHPDKDSRPYRKILK